jgi:predicted MPP superfamily phosphohydrolase
VGLKAVMGNILLERRLSRRAFLKTGARCVAGAGIAGASSLAYASYIEPGWVDVHQVPLTLSRLPAEFDGYRVAQISDIHLDGAWMTRAHLTEVVGLINRQQPDLVAITGDFVTHDAERFAEDLVAALSGLDPKDSVAAVLGNHDYWSNPDIIRGVLRDSGIVNVSNAVCTLRRGGANLHIAGVDDIWEGKDRLDLVLEALPKSGAVILLAHEPDFADTSAATGRFDLQISGHSHGGQVSVPGLGPLHLPYLGRKYPSGLYEVNEMLHYTNRGIGMVRPYVRFNCRPEISVFTLSSG